MEVKTDKARTSKAVVDNQAFRDISKQSRKGRKPKNGVAMTAAERKRLQRERQRQAKSELPSWLSIRLRLWELVQREFSFSDTDELCHALGALEIGLLASHCKRAVSDEEWWYTLQAYCCSGSLDSAQHETVKTCYQELLPYEFVAGEFPKRKGTKLIELLWDIGKCHENEADNTEAASFREMMEVGE